MKGRTNAGGGANGTPYAGDNPLIVTMDGATIPAGTLVKEDLKIKSNMNRGVINTSASGAPSTSFTNALKIAHGLGVVPSYVSMNITGDMTPGYLPYGSSVFNFKSYVTGCIEFLYVFPASSGGSSAGFEGRGYHGNDNFTHLRVRTDANYIYVDYKYEWNSSGSYQQGGAIPKGTLHWVAVA